MSHLTQAQIAALQQMGICVWINADKLASTDTVAADLEKSQSSSVSSKTDNAVSVNRVAQLRESLSQTTPHQTNPVQTPLTDQQRTQYVQFISDINYAWALCHPQKSLPELVVGTSLRVTDTIIELPCEPGQLNADQKANLWTTLWR